MPITGLKRRSRCPRSSVARPEPIRADSFCHSAQIVSLQANRKRVFLRQEHRTGRPAASRQNSVAVNFRGPQNTLDLDQRRQKTRCTDTHRRKFILRFYAPRTSLLSGPPHTQRAGNHESKATRLWHRKRIGHSSSARAGARWRTRLAPGRPGMAAPIRIHHGTLARSRPDGPSPARRSAKPWWPRARRRGRCSTSTPTWSTSAPPPRGELTRRSALLHDPVELRKPSGMPLSVCRNAVGW